MAKVRFPTTTLPVRLWPGSPIDEPPVWRCAAVLENDWLIWVGPVDHHAQLPLELAIRELLSLDLGDRDAVIGFVNEHGMIGIPHQEVLLDGGVSVRDLRRDDASRERDRELRREVSARVGNRPVNHYADVWRFLFDAQRLARTWIAFMDGDYVWPVWFTDDGVKRTGKDRTEWIAELESGAWREFVWILNRGLKGFAARAELVWDDVVLGEPDAGLFSALCVQVYNLMVAGHEEVRTCANESCGYRFVLQRGGAAHGQYRTSGVIYCTNKCAKTQGQRELRRRKKETGS